jgi:hypothetical protein
VNEMQIKVIKIKSLVFIITLTVCISIGISVFVLSNGYFDINSSNSKNRFSENYSAKLRAIPVGTEPELIKAYGIDGTIGYVLSTDLEGVQPKNPKEALEQQSKRSSYREIPLYDVSGKKVIGKFRIGG